MCGMTNEDAACEGDVLIITVPLVAQNQQLRESKNFALVKS